MRAACLVLGMAVVALTGCQDRPAVQPSQVLARVNDTELTRHQVNLMMQAREEMNDASAAERAARQALESLVDEELAVQAAARLRLERKPEVLVALEAARRAVLAQAYMAAAVPAAEPSAEALRERFEASPGRFARRRVYRLNELVIEADAALEARMRARVAEQPDLARLADWLQSTGARFSTRGAVRASEQLAEADAARLASLRPGAIDWTRVDGTLRAVQVAEVREEPVSFEAARPVLAAELKAEQRRAGVAAEIARLRAAARIEYVAPAPDATGARLP